MKKPNLFIIGSLKCGSTSLANWLSEHPCVYMSPLKEPGYFYPHGTIKSLREYEKLFDKAKKQSVVAEASVIYIFHRPSVPEIIKYCGQNVKFIVLIRNPLEMAPSLHAQWLYNLRENEPDFEKAWRNIPNKDLSEINNYGSVCKLGEQIEHLLSVVPAEQCKFILLEDIKRNPRKIWIELMSFLNIEDDGRTDFIVKNKAKAYRHKFIHNVFINAVKIKQKLGITRNFGFLTPVVEFNKIEKAWTPLRKEFREELKRYFKKDIKKLEIILNRDLTHWLSS